MTIEDLLLLAALLTSGLMAGLLYGWAVSVIPGLARVPDHTYVATMQSINRAIINPLFVLTYLGTVVVLSAAAVAQFRVGEGRRGLALAIAAATYLVGVLGVTAARNIPLNNALDAFSLDGATSDAVDDRRDSYERSWNRWHTVRTVAATLALAAAVVAVLLTEESA